MRPIKGREYLVDGRGQPKAVVLDLKEYQRMLKILTDLKDVEYIRRHQHEKLVPMEAIHRKLKKSRLV